MSSSLAYAPGALFALLSTAADRPASLTVTQKPKPEQGRPYCSIPSKIETPIGSTFGKGGLGLSVIINVFSADAGSDVEARELTAWLATKLHGQTLTVTGQTGVILRVQSASVSPDPDGGHMGSIVLRMRMLNA